MNRLTQINTARKNGILTPIRAYNASSKAGLPFYVTCAFLMQETNGGQNIYGHDVNADGSPRPFWGMGAVTKENYEAYKHERDLGIHNTTRFPKLGRRAQGVGPMQLTWWEFQDRADGLGGCWDVANNILVGCQVIKSHYDVARKAGKTDAEALHYAALKYNGKVSYADQMAARFKIWKQRLS